MRPDLRTWLEAAVGAPVRRHELLPVEASHRRFHRIQVAPSAGKHERVLPPAERSVDERRRLCLAGKASAGKQAAATTADDGASANLKRESSFVVMESPPSLERNDAFVAMQRLFSATGLPVPEILAMDLDAGFFVLTDLGNRSLEDAYGGPDRDLALELAVKHLARIQGIAPDGVPAYEESRFRDELHLFVEWFLGGLLRQAPAAAMAPAFEALVANALAQPQCLIHRDYHCRNLLLDAQGRFGIVDFQDALVGPITYDLACLLWDCYHRFNAAERRRWLRRYQEQAGLFGGWDEAALTRALDLTALQRQFKAVGIFARLWLRDGKPTHLRYIAPVLNAMQEIAALYPEVQGLHPWLQQLTADTAKAMQAAQASATAP